MLNEACKSDVIDRAMRSFHVADTCLRQGIHMVVYGAVKDEKRSDGPKFNNAWIVSDCSRDVALGSFLSIPIQFS